MDWKYHYDQAEKYLAQSPTTELFMERALVHATLATLKVPPPFPKESLPQLYGDMNDQTYSEYVKARNSVPKHRKEQVYDVPLFEYAEEHEDKG